MTHDAREQPQPERLHPERLIRGARAARSLSEALWETLEDAAAEHRTARVAELSARLAEVSLTVASLAEDGHRSAPETPHAGSGPGGVAGPGPAGGERTRARARARGLLPEPMTPGRVASEPTEPEPTGSEPVASERVASEPVASERVAPDLVAPEPAPEQVEPPPPHARDGESEPAAAVLVDELAGKNPLETTDAPRVEPKDQPDIEIRDERVPTMPEQDAFVEQEQAQRGHGEPEEPHGEGEPTEPISMVRPADALVEQEQSRHRHAKSAVAQHGYAEPVPAEQDVPPWTVSIERRLERYRQDGHAFALLLLELADVQRLRHAELPGEVARLTTLVESELSAHLRPADSLMRETPGRYWLLAPQTDGLAAQALAEQMTAAVGRAASHRGAPLRLAVGIAVCPRDALDAAELVDRAEVALYEAHAGGRALARDADPFPPYDDLA